MPERESVDDKIKRIFGELLDEREKRAAAAKDPALRFDSVMSRFEKLLDALEDKGDARPSRRRGAADEAEDEGGGEGDLLKVLGFRS